jgi:OmpA-OmpF porin, OOP family
MKSILIVLIALATLPSMAQPYRIENNEVKLEQAIAFKPGSDKLEPSSKDALLAIVQLLKDKAYISTLRVECHSDNTGIEKINQTITERRALAICRELIKMKVDCKRLLAVGFGSTKPVADNATPVGKAQNRRTTLVIAALRGLAIGGMPVDGGGKVAGELCQ